MPEAKPEEKPRVFSVGYETLKPLDLKLLVEKLDVTLIDVRSRPSGRVKRGFSKADLAELLPDRYEHHPELGGHGNGPTVEGLKSLAVDPRRMLLMCQEFAPADCHRHHRIAMPLAVAGVNVFHVYEDELILATELQRALDDDDEYAFTALADVIAAVK